MQIEDFLKEKAPYIELVKNETNGKSCFRNKETGFIFYRSNSELKRDVKNGRRIGFNETKETAQKFLDEHRSEIKIVKWGGSSKVSVFFDSKRRVNFSFVFKTMKHELSRNPNVDFGMSKEEISKKRMNTCIQKYGKITNLLTEETKDKSKKTCIEKYGSPHHMSSDEVKENLKKSMIEKGHWNHVDGMTTSEVAKLYKVSNSTVLNRIEEFRNRPDAKEMAGMSSIEVKISEFLSSLDLEFEKNKQINGKRYDFLVPSKNLIIECDGLYWHSDGCGRNYKGKNYHKTKAELYKSANFDSLFFRENEILNKSHIVKSIIKNKLNLNERIFARKCTISKCGVFFFEQNHLMGSGSGRIYSLEYRGRTVAAIQVKWKSKKDGILEISRFCTKNGTSVVGGYSKLISHVEKAEKPKKIITFVDLRYGDGSYLERLGFQKTSEHLSFSWTDFKNTYHRMRYPGNSGYEKGLFKIWDCGQRLYEKSV